MKPLETHYLDAKRGGPHELEALIRYLLKWIRPRLAKQSRELCADLLEDVLQEVLKDVPEIVLTSNAAANFENCLHGAISRRVSQARGERRTENRRRQSLLTQQVPQHCSYDGVAREGSGPLTTKDAIQALLNELTPRETLVFELARDGMTTKAIAKKLGMGRHNVGRGKTAHSTSTQEPW